MTTKFTHLKKILPLVAFLFFWQIASAQKLVYSEPDRDDSREMSYEIIGKSNNKFLIYKTSQNAHYITAFDAEMKQIDKFTLAALTDRVFNVDFVKYPDFYYLFYQYQKRNIIYCMALKLNVDGKPQGEPLQLDTTDSREVQNNKIYSFVQSANKEFIQFFKINTTQDKVHIVTTILFDKNLNLLQKVQETVPMRERNSFLSAFEVDNKGNFAFIKAIGSNGSDNISHLVLIRKETTATIFVYKDIGKKENIYLDDVKMKADNTNNRYIITSFYSNKRRGDVQGLYINYWDNNTNSEKLNATVAFEDEFRNDAKGDATVKAAFNNYFIKDIIVKKDGGFLITAECEYASTRGGDNFNRWDNINYGLGSTGYYNFGNTGYYAANPWNRWGNGFSVTRYFADNIAIASFDSVAKMQWTNVVRKSQFDDNSDAFIGFGMFNAGSQLKFLFNQIERNSFILNEQSIAPDGQISRSTTLKNLDKGYDFMPRNARQVGAKQIIVPCMLRSFLCFAKIDY